MIEQQSQVQLEHNRKMSAPLTVLEYKGPGVQEIEQFKSEDSEECIVIRTPSKQMGVTKRLLTKSLSQVEDLSCMQKDILLKPSKEARHLIETVENPSYNLKYSRSSSEQNEHMIKSVDADKIKESLEDTKLKNDKMPRTPVKKMVVDPPEDGSPLDTKFQWIAVDKEECQSEVNEDLTSQSEEFLREVQHVFEKKDQ